MFGRLRFFVRDRQPENAIACFRLPQTVQFVQFVPPPCPRLNPLNFHRLLLSTRVIRFSGCPNPHNICAFLHHAARGSSL
ncbi:hypothetical protein GCWU000324_02520 [Kingella oralis ATCC 51147]|uniref:Uncharacterized protein n=1 Tax=Kingella oralis ATCC 51147 TaxID=629741 RepID=C4GLE9_9NEIS|nr:hypothetical protein GCWU000324_02520 [Kingella oralis ATCC 51147]